MSTVEDIFNIYFPLGNTDLNLNTQLYVSVCKLLLLNVCFLGINFVTFKKVLDESFPRHVILYFASSVM